MKFMNFVARLSLLLLVVSFGIINVHAATKTPGSYEELQQMKNSDKTLYFIEGQEQVMNGSILIENNDVVIEIEQDQAKPYAQAVWRMTEEDLINL